MVSEKADRKPATFRVTLFQTAISFVVKPPDRIASQSDIAPTKKKAGITNTAIAIPIDGNSSPAEEGIFYWL
jgi:hypothetical protein